MARLGCQVSQLTLALWHSVGLFTDLALGTGDPQTWHRVPVRGRGVSQNRVVSAMRTARGAPGVMLLFPLAHAK